ncbi:DUF503 domain-containing protein [bacterium]|nr:DUF503 domain-containing protein [bacterium]
MRIGICTFYLMIPDSQSLKDKRQVLKSLKDQMRNKFNVSIAEVDAQNHHRQATLGVVCVANDTQNANRLLSKVVNYVEQFRLAEMINYEIEII